MSPEQARGEALDRRTDVWSFGCVLYEMLAGGRAFPGHTAEAVAAVLEREPVWGALPGETPAKVVHLLHRCLQKDRNRRLHDVADARIELDEALAEPAPPAARAGSSPGRLSRVRRWGALAAGLLLVAGLTALAFYWSRRTDEAPRVGGSEPVPLTAYQGRETEPAFSPDGNQVAFVWDGPRRDNADIYVKLIGTEEPLRLPRDPAPDVSPAWSPDGRSIAFLRLGPDEVEEERRSSALVLVPAIGGAERRVAEVGAGSIRSTVAYRYWTADALPLVAWTPDGRWLIVADWESAGQPLGLFAFSLESGERRRLTSPPARRDSAPAVSPDGRTLVFARSFAPGVSELQRLALSADLAPSGDPRPLTSLRQWSTSPSWLPDGREIVFSSGNWALGRHDLWRVPAFGGTPSRLPFTGQDASGPAVSRQGRRLAFARPIARENLFRLELEGGKIVSEPAPWAPSTRVDQNPKYSADGRRVAFLSSRSGTLEVWIAGADGGDLRQLTQMGAPVTGGVGWSPDGRFLVFCSTREGNWELYAVAVAGGSPRRLTSHPAADALGSFSADGRFVYFASTRGGRASPPFDIWKMPWRPPGEPAAPVPVTTGGGRFGFEAPDGRLFYYVPQASVAQPGTLFRVGVEGGEPRRIAGPVSFLNLSVNAEGAYFMTPVEGGRSRLNFCDHRTLSVRELGTIEGRVGTGLTVSPDGRTLLFARVGEMGGDLMLVEGFR
jgi:Tol biopolymer transport system component